LALVKVETCPMKSLVGCFWHKGSTWEGVLEPDLDNLEIRVIKSENAILLLRKNQIGEPGQSSNGNNLSSH